MHLPELMAIVDPENFASVRVVEKAGFQYDREIAFDGYTHPDKVFVYRRSDR